MAKTPTKQALRIEETVNGPVIDPHAVEWTDEYDVFDRDDNREVNWKHVDNLAKRMKEVGYLPGYPVVINSKCIVRDGQHRLLAAQKAQVKFCYIVDDSIDVLSVAEANRLVQRWTGVDYLQYAAKQGDATAIWVQTFAAENKLPLAALLRVLTRTVNYSAKSDRARRSIPNAAKIAIRRWVSNYEEVCVHCPALRNMPIFMEAAFSVISREDYVHDRMMVALGYQSTRLTRCATMKHYEDLLLFIYNYKLPAASRMEEKKGHRGAGHWEKLTEKTQEQWDKQARGK